MHFDESRHDYGKIWLRPQTEDLERKQVEDRFSLNLTFTIDTRPDLATMNDLAMSLRFLPHVEKISFEKLYSPRDRLVNLVQYVKYAQRLRTCFRKVRIRRQHRKAWRSRERFLGKPALNAPGTSFIGYGE